MTCHWCGTEYASKNRWYCSRMCSNHAKTKGGLQFSQGRWFVRTRDGSKQHYSRCLMEAHLGRELDHREHVHHINGDKSDDRLENLVVLHESEHHAIHVAQGDYGRPLYKLTREDIDAFLLSDEPSSSVARRLGVTPGAVAYHRKKAAQA